MDTQWSDGFGGRSCELAHLLLSSADAIGHAQHNRVAKLFVDVVQAYASIVVALCLPLAERVLDARGLLTSAGLASSEIDAVMAEGQAAEEWQGS